MDPVNLAGELPPAAEGGKGEGLVVVVRGIFLVFRLLHDFPAIGIPVVVILVLAVIALVVRWTRR